MLQILSGAALLVALAAGCSGDSKSAGQKACADLATKLSQCQLTLPAGRSCNTGNPCVVECAVNATCEELAASPPKGAYLACVAACSGAGPTDFVCASGTAYVPRAAVCDGTPQCPDGSDEKSCGAPDAGSG